VPSGVCNRLAAVHFGSIAAIAQGTTKNIAGGQIQAVAVQHWNVYIFIFLINFLKKKNSFTTLKGKSNDSC